MVLWKRKKPFQDQKGPLRVEKEAFGIKKLFIGTKRGKASLKGPLCLKRPGRRLGGVKRHVGLPFGRLVGATAQLPLPPRVRLCDENTCS